jgi:hypothetical protein
MRPTDLAGEVDVSDFQGIIAILQLVNLVVLIVLFCIWIYRANSNARQLGATDMQFSPGWSVGWYFIPIANLWKPYQAMCEIWRASRRTGNNSPAARSCRCGGHSFSYPISSVTPLFD